MTVREAASPKRILLIVGGGIAAYKALDLCRLIRRRGLLVRAIMTRAAGEFVTPLSLGSVTGDKVYGLASTALLATDKKILVAPAMNLRMWAHPATRRSIERLKADGVAFVGPTAGSMACGEFGVGRLAEPADILIAIEEALAGETALPLPEGAWAAAADGERPLSGRRVVVTSGPTREPIDPVRYISNHSSGKQGHAIAAAAAAAGADVLLISGPVAIPDPFGVATVHVETAREMQAAVERALPADIFVAAAAVADWRIEHEAAEKMKKDGGGPPSLAMAENPDILAGVGRRIDGRPALVVGFAAETEKVLEHARAKLARKGCDLIVANDVGRSGETPGGVFGGSRNTVHLVDAAGVESWPTMGKEQIAERLVAALAARFSLR